MLRFIKSLVLLLLLSGIGYAHDHSPSPEADLKLVEGYLEAVFVELDRVTEGSSEAAPEARLVLFRGYDGKLFSLPKGRLAEALAKGYLAAVNDRCSHSHEKSDDASCALIAKEDKKGLLEIWSRRILGVLMAPVHGAKDMAIQLPRHLSYLLAQTGVLPAAVVTLLWIPYSIVTETLESTVMGAYHWACPFFQAVFWGPVLYLVFDFNLVKDVVLYRKSGLGIFSRFVAAFSSRAGEALLQRTLHKIVLTEIPAIVRKGDLKDRETFHFHDNPVADELMASPLWFDFFEHRLLNPALGVAAKTGVRAFGETLERMASLYLLRGFIKKQLDLAHEAGRITYWGHVASLYDIGRLDLILGSLHRSLWIAGRDESYGGPKKLAWLQASEHTLLVAMRRFFETIAGRTDRESLKTALDQAEAAVLRFRNGEVDRCEVEIAVAELEVDAAEAE